jgi:hypothetical protein
VPKPLVICRSCGCHVRVGEAVCPHCGVDLVAVGATVEPRRRSFEVRRVVFATALASLSTASCGGKAVDSNGTASAASEQDILGACMHSGGTSVRCAEVLPPPNATCRCGPAGTCQNGACIANTCGPDQYLDSSGSCDSIPYWFLPSTSTHGCYGAPPFLG